MRARIKSISFIRAVCAVGILVFHYNCVSINCPKLFFETANGNWGFILVTVFFTISGGVLYYNYPRITSLRAFYYKRWKSIFPMFYILFAYYYTQNVFKTGNILYKGSPASLILTALGMDGYFQYAIQNYYIIGEWFLGAIIMMYILYPFLIIALSKRPTITISVIIICYCSVLLSNAYKIAPTRNLFTCILSFTYGIILIKNIDIINRRSVLVFALCLFVIIVAIPLPLEGVWSVPKSQIAAFSLIVVLFNLGRCIMNCARLEPAITELDKLSYPIFLLQHMALIHFLHVKDPAGLKEALVWCMFILLYTIVCAKAISVVVAAVLGSKPMQRLDRIFLTNTRSDNS